MCGCLTATGRVNRAEVCRRSPKVKVRTSLKGKSLRPMASPHPFCQLLPSLSPSTYSLSFLVIFSSLSSFNSSHLPSFFHPSSPPPFFPSSLPPTFLPFLSWESGMGSSEKQIRFNTKIVSKQTSQLLTWSPLLGSRRTMFMKHGRVSMLQMKNIAQQLLRGSLS